MSKSKLTLEQQIKKHEELIRQEQNKLKQKQQKAKAQKYKDRTHRLIERGAILESLIDGAIILTNEQIKTLLQIVLSVPTVREKITTFVTENALANAENETTEIDTP